jgi:hypothetical protein
MMLTDCHRKSGSWIGKPAKEQSSSYKVRRTHSQHTYISAGYYLLAFQPAQQRYSIQCRAGRSQLLLQLRGAYISWYAYLFRAPVQWVLAAAELLAAIFNTLNV